MTVTLNREKLRATRKEKELTQEELAEHSAISDRYVRSLETGAAEPSASVLYRISRTLEVPMDELITMTAEERDVR